jgi:DNA polymerase III subunit delta'
MAARPALLDHPSADERDGTIAPRDSAGVLGQDRACRLFLESWQSGRFHHAWLLCGTEGIGKATFAWRAARHVLDRTASAAFGGAPDSQSNHLVSAQSHPDLVRLRRTWDETRKKHRSEIRVDDVRDLKQHFQLAAGFGGYRVAIIDSMDDMNSNAANALLKLLEEPPEKCLFLLICHHPARLLPTIRSRCRRLEFADLDAAAVHTILKRQPAAEGMLDDALREAAALAKGSVARALRYLSPAALDLRRKSEALLGDLPQINAGRWMALSRDFQKKDADGFGIFLEAAQDFAFGAALTASAKAGGAALSEASAEMISTARQADTYNLDQGAAALAILQSLQSALR